MVRLVYGEDDRVGEWLYPKINGDWIPGRAQTIGLEREGELVAGAAFENYNKASVFGSLVVTGRASKEFLVAAFAYPFIQLGVTKLISMVDENLEDARRLNEKLGFVLEHAIKDAHPDGAILIYSMMRKECRFLPGGDP